MSLYQVLRFKLRLRDKSLKWRFWVERQDTVGICVLRKCPPNI